MRGGGRRRSDGRTELSVCSCVGERACGAESAGAHAWAQWPADEEAERRRVLELIEARSQVLRTEMPGSGGGAPRNVRVVLAFQAVPNLEIAERIMVGNFATISSRDAGFYGQGKYFTLDPYYAASEYGPASGEVPLVMVALVLGNVMPIIDCSQLGAAFECVAGAQAAAGWLGADALSHCAGLRRTPTRWRWRAIRMSLRPAACCLRRTSRRSSCRR